MTILEKNIQALLSGVNEPLGNKLLNFIQNKTCSRFNIDENLNIYDKTHNIFMYENLEEELNFFYQSILEKTPRYPFICIYGISNALLIKNLAKHYKHLFVFESEIELFILALSTMDLSEEIISGNIYLIDVKDPKMDLQLSVLFDQKDLFEYLELYELFYSANYYIKFYCDTIKSINKQCINNIHLVIRNFDPDSSLTFCNYEQFLINIPKMLYNIPVQRLINERKNRFETAIVVSAGPSLNKQLSLLKEYQDKAVIFCADGALPMLANENIIPDYISNIDFKDLPLKFFQNNEKILENSICLLANATHPSIVNFLNNYPKSIVLSELPYCLSLNLEDFGYIDIGTHVSHFSYALALEMGFKNIIMIGQDLAFDEDGNSHSVGFVFGHNFKHEEQFPKIKIPSYGDKGEVITHVAWNDYRKKLEYFFARNANKAIFYNATEGGAKINFTKELSFKECCQKLLHIRKPKLDIPKILTRNRSKKILDKISQKLSINLSRAEELLSDAVNLKYMLNKIINSDKDLTLEYLNRVYISIDNFNTMLTNNDFIQDGTLKGTFFFRGSLMKQVIESKIIDDKIFLVHFIKIYSQWLEIFIEKLSEKNEITKKALTLYNTTIK